jgi:hypothetical protein
MRRAADQKSRLATDVEERLRTIEDRSAACYTSAERTAAELFDLAARINDEDEEDGVVPEEAGEENSLIIAIADVKKRTQPV